MYIKMFIVHVNMKTTEKDLKTDRLAKVLWIKTNKVVLVAGVGNQSQMYPANGPIAYSSIQMWQKLNSNQDGVGNSL